MKRNLAKIWKANEEEQGESNADLFSYSLHINQKEIFRTDQLKPLSQYIKSFCLLKFSLAVVTYD